PALNPLYRDVLAHHGAVPLPCRVRDADRKGKVERSVGHAKNTPLKGLRFESLADAQAYLDRWEERWADTRIHGTTKRQVAAMFAEEGPHLQPLPLEGFRYYQYGSRIVHLDGCVEIDSAYYHAPPGWVGRVVHVQWDGTRVRLLDQRGQLLREYLPEKRGGRRSLPGDEPKHAHPRMSKLPPAAGSAGTNVGAPCDALRRREGEAGRRRDRRRRMRSAPGDRRRRLPLAASVPRAPGSHCAGLAQAGRSAHSRTHPLPRPHHREDPRRANVNVIELNRALRQLRLSGMADTLETRLLHAQTEKLAPIDFLSTLVSDELMRRQDRLLERRIKQAGFRDPGRTLDAFDFDFNRKMNRRLVFELATGRFVAQHEDALLLGPPGTGKSHLAQAIGLAVIQQGYRVLYRETHVLLEEL